MTDPRIERWAKTLVGYCLNIQPGHVVLINSTPLAEPLILATYREVLRAGGHPVVRLQLEGLTEALLSGGNDEQLAWLNPADRAQMEHANATLGIGASANTRALTNVAPARQAIVSRTMRELGNIRQRREAEGLLHWCGTLYPTSAHAQDAEMSLGDFEEFVFGACFLNEEDPGAAWARLGRAQQHFVHWLRGKHTVRVVGQDTDLRLSIEGRVFINSDGKRNFPSGEFFTSPVEDSAEGHIRYTIPSIYGGRPVQDIRLRFEQGRVVEASAAQGDAFLQQMLEMDAGARYLGEFAFGNNFGITHGIRNILFDEKIGGTVHLALGNSYPETGGQNTSALHWDMVCDLRPAAGGGEVWVDDELFLKD
ncbi:MAG TPA: aminopeptidase, partial [Ktedonobacterales bacterium]|nr:aminopeptidase [Ktedonobacterales bacterium]